MKQVKVLILMMFYLCIPGLLPGNAEKTHAERMVRAGRYPEAIQSYRRYLETKDAQNEFAQTLIRASMLEPDARKGLNLLLLYDKKMTTTEDRKRIFERIGLLQEYFLNDESAVAAYQIAFENSYPPDYQLYLRVGFLSLEVGEAERSLSVARVILSNSRDTELRLAAINLSLLSYANLGDLDRGLSLIYQERSFLNRVAGASYYYTLARFYQANQESRKAQEVKEKIIKEYPESPEAMILQGKARVWSSPANLFF
ncbi:MAG: tetratricopeptide repeat protein [Spirochaetia bacterium]